MQQKIKHKIKTTVRTEFVNGSLVHDLQRRAIKKNDTCMYDYNYTAWS